VLAALLVDEDSGENEFDELKPRMCEVDEEIDRKQDTVQEYFQILGRGRWGTVELGAQSSFLIYSKS